MRAQPLGLRPGDRELLESWTRSSIRAGLAQRARMVLLAADGFSNTEIAERVGVSRPTVIGWRNRYASSGVRGLEDERRTGRPRTVDRAQILAATLSPPPAGLGVTHWSSRLLAEHLGVDASTVLRTWRHHRVQPWRVETFKLGTLDRRTAWVALLAGMITLMFHDRRLGRRAIWAVVIILGVVIGAYSTVQIAATSGEPVAQAASNTGSVIWRVEGWAVLLSQWASSPLNWFTGEPFGTSFLRRVEGSEVVGSPHDFYIEILLRTGALGLLALLALTVGLLVATWRRSAEDAGVFGSGVLAALLMMQLIWFITWTPGIEQGIVTGIAISLAGRPITYRPDAIVDRFGGRSTQEIGV